MKCIHCGKEHPISHFNLDENDNPVCLSCFDKYYTRCSSCLKLMPKGQTMCLECSRIIFRKMINDYSTKVTALYGNKDNNNTKCLNDRYYGLEMEFNNFNPISARLLFKKQYDDLLIYNKPDASISSGVEIVTIPLVKSRALKLIDDMDITRIEGNGGDVTSNAGLHIHVSKNTITPIARHRLALLFNGAWSRPYKKYIYYLVGRSKSVGSRIDSSYFEMGKNSIRTVYYESNNGGHGRAINFANKNTVEFRLFKATTNPVQLKSYIEFVDLAIKFTEEQPIKRMTIPNFITYLYVNVTNPWLRERLQSIKENHDKLFEAKDKVFTFDYYLDKFDTQDVLKTYRFLETCIENRLDINWNVDKIDVNMVDTYTSKSLIPNIGDVLESNLIDSLMKEIKTRTINKILAK